MLASVVVAGCGRTTGSDSRGGVDAARTTSDGVAGSSFGGGMSGGSGTDADGVGTHAAAGADGMAGALNGDEAHDACTDPDRYEAGKSMTFPERRRTTATGTNGSFTDRCDADGNLIEYICDAVTV